MRTNFDVTSALDALGIDYQVHGNEANSICPQHEQRTGKEDHSPSWWINLSTGVHTCFSCGYRGNLIHLVCDVKEFYSSPWKSDVIVYDWWAAEEWLKTCADVSIDQLLSQLVDLPSYVRDLPKPLEMSEARLAIFDAPPAEALSARNITAEAAATYGILWDNKKSAWILPLRDAVSHALLGWQEKGTVDRTFFNRPTGLKKSKTLFGVETQNADIAILVESPLDCARVLSAGQVGAVASCGATVSEDQVKLLRYSNKVVVALDNPALDSAGLKGDSEMLEWGRKYGLNLFFFNYGATNKKDPGDMTNEEIRWGVENAVSALYGESAYVQGDAKTVSG